MKGFFYFCNLSMHRKNLKLFYLYNYEEKWKLQKKTFCKIKIPSKKIIGNHVLYFLVKISLHSIKEKLVVISETALILIIENA